MTHSESKTCPVCAEEIKRAAKVCPHCRQWQTRFGIRHPATLTLMMVLCVCVLAVGFVVLLLRITDPKPSYNDFQGRLIVTESRTTPWQTERGDLLVIVGLMTNQTPFAWKEVQFDCRYFDTNGALIDATTGFGRGAIYGHGESAFRVDLKVSRPLSDYAFHKISVKAARNAAAWP